MVSGKREFVSRRNNERAITLQRLGPTDKAFLTTAVRKGPVLTVTSKYNSFIIIDHHIQDKTEVNSHCTCRWEWLYVNELTE